MAFTMNRQQKRDFLKPGGAEKVIMEVWNQVHDEVSYLATRDALTLAILVLRDKYGFGGVRLRRLLEGVAEHAEAVKEGRVKMNEIINAMKKEVPDIESFWQRYHGKRGA